MEIDHFNPRLLGLARNKYSNLFLATRHCNGAKSNHWPEKRQRLLGVRLLNPTKEQDYGSQIFEDPTTHRLIGATPAGIYHIRICDLNAPHLVNERANRAELRRILHEYMPTLKIAPGTVGKSNLLDSSSLLRDIVEKMIPPIPPPVP
jgi:hypothetical protein